MARSTSVMELVEALDACVGRIREFESKRAEDAREIERLERLADALARRLSRYEGPGNKPRKGGPAGGEGAGAPGPGNKPRRGGPAGGEGAGAPGPGNKPRKGGPAGGEGAGGRRGGGPGPGNKPRRGGPARAGSRGPPAEPDDIPIIREIRRTLGAAAAGRLTEASSVTLVDGICLSLGAASDASRSVYSVLRQRAYSRRAPPAGRGAGSAGAFSLLRQEGSRPRADLQRGRIAGPPE